jgi:hypothetical protein
VRLANPVPFDDVTGEPHSNLGTAGRNKQLSATGALYIAILGLASCPNTHTAQLYIFPRSQLASSRRRVVSKFLQVFDIGSSKHTLSSDACWKARIVSADCISQPLRITPYTHCPRFYAFHHSQSHVSAIFESPQRTCSRHGGRGSTTCDHAPRMAQADCSRPPCISSYAHPLASKHFFSISPLHQPFSSGRNAYAHDMDKEKAHHMDTASHGPQADLFFSDTCIWDFSDSCRVSRMRISMVTDKDPQWLTEHKTPMVSNKILGAVCAPPLLRHPP